MLQIGPNSTTSPKPMDLDVLKGNIIFEGQGRP